MNPKTTIVLESDDELPDIYEKLKGTKEKEINLYVPRQSILLQSIVNLKILKRKIQELKKDVTLCTKDRKSIKLIENAGLPVTEDKSFDPFASKQAGSKKTESKGSKKGVLQGIKQRFTDVMEKEPKNFIFSKPSRKPFFSFVILSLVLFFLIIYIALPSATVTIKPTLKVQQGSLNVEMIQKDKMGKIASDEDRIIPFYPVTVTYERTIDLTPTGRIYKGTPSSGKITLYNTRAEPWSIVPNSRLQTKDDLVFLTRYFVTVPGGSAATPGTAVVDVVARDKDANDVFIGSRGNIAPTRLFFPALSEFNQKLIYGENKEAFQNGTDQFEYFVTKEDLAIAEQKIVAELTASSISELKREIDTTSSATMLPKLFDRSDKLLSKTINETQVRAKENDKTQDFQSWGKMTATGYYYNQQDLENILKNNLIVKHISPTEKILKLKDDSLLINEVLEVHPEIAKVKVNASLEGIVAYDFTNSKLDLVQEIKNNIVGKRKDEAEKYVNNLKEISEGRVSVWPLWSPTLPTIPENIKIEIEE